MIPKPQLIAAINQLNKKLLIESQVIDLDHRCRFKGASYQASELSLREYLTLMVNANQQKANTIYDLLVKNPPPTIKELEGVIGQRRYFSSRSSPSVGSQIFSTLIALATQPASVGDVYQQALPHAQPKARVKPYLHRQEYRFNHKITGMNPTVDFIIPGVDPTHYRRSCFAMLAYESDGRVKLTADLRDISYSLPPLLSTIITRVR